MKMKVGDHPRITDGVQSSLHCGAKTRAGSECRSPAVRGKKRCRMQGVAAGSGPPQGNRNASKHGDYNRETLEELGGWKRLFHDSQKTLGNLS